MIRKLLPLLLCGCVLISSSVQAGDAEAGKVKSKGCAGCHGADGKGDADNPAIAGMTIENFTLAINEYKSGVRTNSKKMTKQASKLSDEDIANLAAYYSALN